jgi:hypothetical protein
MLDLDQVVKERHSTRMFLPKPVPQELVDEAVALAVGYSDPDFSANNLHTERDPVQKHVVLLNSEVETKELST